MAVTELLARLNVKLARYEMGGGGAAELTPEMIAAACAHLPRGAWYLGLVKYAHRLDAVKDLEIAAWLHAADLAVKYRWSVERGKPYLRTIAQLACAHVVDAHRCGCCGGTGLNIQRRSCKRCDGTGIEPAESMRATARRAGIPFETFRTTWEPRYRIVVAEITAWDIELEAALKAHLEH